MSLVERRLDRHRRRPPRRRARPDRRAERQLRRQGDRGGRDPAARPSSRSPRPPLAEPGPVAVLVAARDESGRIGETVAALQAGVPGAVVIVADDGSRDATADEAEAAGATRAAAAAPRQGPGAHAGRARRTGRGACCSATPTSSGDLSPLVGGRRGRRRRRLRGAPGRRLRHRQGDGSRRLIRALAGLDTREPLSGQRALSPAARAAVVPARRRLRLRGPEHGRRRPRRASSSARSSSRSRHRATGRDAAGFLHRGRQLVDILLACGPLAVNHRGLRLPLVGWAIALRREPAVAAIAAIGLADDLWSGPERGFAAHLRSGRTTGVLKLAGIPLVGLLATRKLSGALLVGLAANALNQLDTRPGRALKAYLAASIPLGAPEEGRCPAALLRSSRDGDAGGRGVERARRAARLELRESSHGQEAAGSRSERWQA